MDSQQFSQTTNSSSYLDALLNIDQNEDNRSSLSKTQKLSQSDNNTGVDPLLGVGQDNGVLDLMQWQLSNLSPNYLSQNDPFIPVEQDELMTELLQASDSLLATGQEQLSSSEPIEPTQSSEASPIDRLLGVNQEATLLSAASPQAQAVPSPNSDVGYTFTYVFGNGDVYRGYGYIDASASAGYYAGQVIYRADETYYNSGQYGYYYIESVTNMGVDYGYQNQVIVTQYYDSETRSNAPYLYNGNGISGYGSGTSGLGSESGYAYNYSFTNQEVFFGYGYYEADMTTV